VTVWCAGWEGTVASQPAHRTVTYREYYTRCCIDTIRPPDNEHRVARNMYRIILINVLYNVIVHQVGHLARVYHTLSTYVTTFVFSSIFFCVESFTCVYRLMLKSGIFGTPPVPALRVKSKFDTCSDERHKQSSFKPPFKVLLDIF